MKNEDNKINKMKVLCAVFGVVLILLAVLAIIAFFFTVRNEYIDFRNEIARIDEEREQVTTHTTFLASIDYQSEIKGSFRLGLGSGRGEVSEQQYYVAYEILEDNGKKLFKMPADITTIYDTLDENAQAYVEIDENYYGVFAMRLYVPKGTITQEYDLSLE